MTVINPGGGSSSSGVEFPIGGIMIWSGSVASIAAISPGTWQLCDGTLGTPDLRDQFVVGAGGALAVGATGGAASLAHAVTQPNAHAFTQPSGHSNHSFTQPNAHSFTQPNAHSFTQPSGHSNHSFTQPGNHSAHAALATHSHELPFIKVAGGTGVLRMLASSIFGTGTSRTPESVSAAPTANTTAGNVELSQAVTGGTPDAHSAHSGGAVDAHSAHSGGAVDAHAGGAVDAHTGGAVDAHSAHSGGAVDAHAGTAVATHADSRPPYFALCYIMRIA